MEVDKKRKLACDSCKRKKLKCEWEEDNICIRCSRTGTACVPQPINQRKKREKRPNTYLSSLEDRLKKMEAAMMRKISIGDQSPGARRSSEDMGNQALVDEMSLLKIHDDGSTKFVGAASGFSIFSPKGLKWITEKTGDQTFAHQVTNIPASIDNPDINFQSKLWVPIPEEEREPLPPRHVAAGFIKSYFHKFGPLFPVFDQPAFLERFHRQYPVSSSEDVVWYANLNVVCAMGCVSNYDRGPKPTSPGASPKYPKAQDTAWWKWFLNACNCFMELQFREPSLGAVQAMVSMSLILQTLPDPDPCNVVAGVAMRLAQAIGLHRNVNAFGGLTDAAMDERRNTFWVGLLVERGVSFRLGRPTSIREDDIGIDFPKANDQGLIPGHFRAMAKLGILQGRIYNKLYSAKSLAKTTVERLQRIGILDEELEDWKDSIPAGFRPGNKIAIDLMVAKQHDDIIPVLIMHFAYFNALTIIHRVSNHHGPWMRKREDPLNVESQESGLNPRVFAGNAICVGAARSVIELMTEGSSAIGAGDLNIIRLVAYYPLTASLTLFANILQNPLDPHALQDIERMYSVCKFLGDFYDEFETNEGRYILGTFTEINRLASEFVRKSRTEATQASKVLKRSSDQFTLVAPEDLKVVTQSGWGDPLNSSSQPPVDQSFMQTDPSGNASLFDRTGNDSSVIPKIEPDLPILNGYQSAPRQSMDIPSQPSNPQPFDLQFGPLETPTNNLYLQNDPLDLLDSNKAYAEGTPESNLASEQQTPEWMDTDELMMNQDASWYFPISNPWDIYFPNNGQM